MIVQLKIAARGRPLLSSYLVAVANGQMFGRSPLVVLLEVDAWRSHACPFDGTTMKTQGHT